MISDFRMLFLTISIYFILDNLGIFETFEDVLGMKGQSELIKTSGKIILILVGVFLLTRILKMIVPDLMEGVENEKPATYETFLKQLGVMIENKEPSIQIINYVGENKELLEKSSLYGGVKDCPQQMIDGNKEDAIRCIKLRILENTLCDINSSNETTECTIDYIMKDINLLSKDDRMGAYKIIKDEIDKDNEISKKTKLAWQLDKTILSLVNEENDISQIEYILNTYSGILTREEKTFFENMIKQ
jgi:hypothetical protein|tara:strand:+ start:30 stop:767 length:738 start_codon:yes stop_codon:yes gene_type:complete